jgi:hypothetical protein
MLFSRVLLAMTRSGHHNQVKLLALLMVTLEGSCLWDNEHLTQCSPLDIFGKDIYSDSRPR